MISIAAWAISIPVHWVGDAHLLHASAGSKRLSIFGTWNCGAVAASRANDPIGD